MLVSGDGRRFRLPTPFGGDEEDRTPDPLLARQVLSQLSYTPTYHLTSALNERTVKVIVKGASVVRTTYEKLRVYRLAMVGLGGLEPPTSRLSGVRSNRLSYKPIFFFSFGGHLLSHTVSSAVPSASQVLTIVFGMGTGVSPGRIATEKFCTL